MIEMLFYHGSEIVLIRIDGAKVMFASTVYGAKETDISGLKLDYTGVIREFPELKECDDWKEKAVQRFKAHIKSLKDEKARGDYIAQDLQKHGYLLKRIQRQGFRAEVIN